MKNNKIKIALLSIIIIILVMAMSGCNNNDIEQKMINSGGYRQEGPIPTVNASMQPTPKPTTTPTPAPELKDIEIRTGDKTYVYDGTAKSAEISVITPVTGYTIEYSRNGSTYTTGRPTITDVGELITYYKITAKGYKTLTGSVKTTITYGSIGCSVKNLNAEYTGQPQTITITVTKPTSGYTIKYGTKAGEYNLTTIPTRTNVGTTTVYFQITAPNYTTRTGSGKINIISAENPMQITAENKTFTYDGSPKTGRITMVEPTQNATIKYGTSANTCTSTNPPTITTPGTLTIYYEASAQNYQTTSGSFNVTVEPATISYKATNKTFKYDGQPHTIEITMQKPSTGYTIKYGDNASNYTYTTPPTLTNIGTKVIYFKITATGYTNATGKASVTITDNPTITADIQTSYQKEYDGKAVTKNNLITNVNPSTAKITYTTTSGGTYSETFPTFKNAGTYKLWYKITADGYNDKTGYINIKITQKPLSATWKPLTFEYTGGVQKPAPTLTGIISGETCTPTTTITAGDGEKGISIGTHTIKITSLSNTNYYVSSGTEQEYTITAASSSIDSIQIETLPKDYNYDGTYKYPVVALYINGNRVHPSEFTYTYKNNKDAGKATVIIEDVAGGSYTIPKTTFNNAFEIYKKAVHVNWTKSTFTYDGAMHGPEGTIDNLCTNADTNTPDSVQIVPKTKQKNASSQEYSTEMQLTGAQAKNYTINNGDDVRKFTINPKYIDDITWSTSSTTYNKNEQKPTATVTGLVSGDTCTVTSFVYKNASGTTVTSMVNAGTYTVQATKLSNDNYKLPEPKPSTTFRITPKPVNLVWGTTTSWEYDGENHIPSVTASVPYTESTPVTVTTTGQQKNAGTHTATATALNNANYVISDTTSKTQSFTIKQKPITSATWSGLEYKYDGNQHTATAIPTGLVGHDTCNLTTNGSGTDAGSYTITIKSADNPNYDCSKLIGTTKTMVISPIDVTIAWSNTQKTYDGTTQLPTAKVNGLIKNETCSVVMTGGASDAGTYTITADSLSNSNYKLPDKKPTVSMVIQKRKATIRWNATTTFTYTGNVQKPTINDIDNIINGDIVTATITTTPSTSKEVGDYTATATLSGNKAKNYYTDDANKTIAFTIEKATIEDQVKNYQGTYDGSKHSIQVTVKKPTSGYTIQYNIKTSEYSDNNASDWSTNNPTFVNVGNYTVYYRITAPNYKVKKGSGTIEIKKDLQSSQNEAQIEQNFAVEFPPTRTVYYKEDKDENPLERIITITKKQGSTATIYYGALLKGPGGRTGIGYYKHDAITKYGANHIVTIDPDDKNWEYGDVPYTPDGNGITWDSANNEWILSSEFNKYWHYDTAPKAGPFPGRTTVYYKIVNSNQEVKGSYEVECIQQKIGFTKEGNGSTIDYDGKNHYCYVKVTDPNVDENLVNVAYGFTYAQCEENSLCEDNNCTISTHYHAPRDFGVALDGANKQWKWAPPLKQPGSYTIYYKIEAYDYKTERGSMTYTIKAGDINAYANNVTVGYDGKPHGITVNVTYPDNPTIKYGTSYGTYNLSSLTYTNAGSYNIYWQVTAPGCTPKTGMATLTITGAQAVASANNVTYEYDGKDHNITVKVYQPTNGYTIYYSTDNASWSTTVPKIKNAGSSLLTYWKVTAPNYSDATGYATVNIKKGYKDPTYVWADNMEYCTGTTTRTDGTDKITETVQTTKTITQQPNCAGPGKAKYTATFTKSQFSTQTKTVDVPKTYDHVWSTTQFSTGNWSQISAAKTTWVQTAAATTTSKNALQCTATNCDWISLNTQEYQYHIKQKGHSGYSIRTVSVYVPPKGYFQYETESGNVSKYQICSVCGLVHNKAYSTATIAAKTIKGPTILYGKINASLGSYNSDNYAKFAVSNLKTLGWIDATTAAMAVEPTSVSTPTITIPNKVGTSGSIIKVGNVVDVQWQGTEGMSYIVTIKYATGEPIAAMVTTQLKASFTITNTRKNENLTVTVQSARYAAQKASVTCQYTGATTTSTLNAFAVSDDEILNELNNGDNYVSISDLIQEMFEAEGFDDSIPTPEYTGEEDHYVILEPEPEAETETETEQLEETQDNDTTEIIDGIIEETKDDTAQIIEDETVIVEPTDENENQDENAIIVEETTEEIDLSENIDDTMQTDKTDTDVEPTEQDSIIFDEEIFTLEDNNENTSEDENENDYEDNTSAQTEDEIIIFTDDPYQPQDDNLNLFVETPILTVINPIFYEYEETPIVDNTLSLQWSGLDSQDCYVEITTMDNIIVDSKFISGNTCVIELDNIMNDEYFTVTVTSSNDMNNYATVFCKKHCDEPETETEQTFNMNDMFTYDDTMIYDDTNTYDDVIIID